MNTSLQYVDGRAARAIVLLEEDNVKDALMELAIGLAYLANYLRKGEGPRSSGEQPEIEE